MAPTPVDDILEVPAALEVLPEEASIPLAGRVDEMGSGESWEPIVDSVEDAVVLGSVCCHGHLDTG